MYSLPSPKVYEPDLRLSHPTHATFPRVSEMAESFSDQTETCGGAVSPWVNAASLREDWRGVLRWEGRMEELMAHQQDAGCNLALEIFSRSHTLGIN